MICKASPIDELENEILNNGEISSILRKALIIANKLNLTDFEEWIKSELNGYEDYSELPEYRKIDCELVQDRIDGIVAAYTITQNEPVFIEDSEINALARKLYYRGSISEIISICNEHEKGVRFNTPRELQQLLGNVAVYRLCHISKLENIIEQVKNELIFWCIKLDENDIHGENYQFSEDEKIHAKNIIFNLVETIL